MSRPTVSRTVRFFEVQLHDTTPGQEGPTLQQKWNEVIPHVHQSISSAKPDHRLAPVTRNGLEYVGWADNDSVTNENYLLIGKRRSASDNPGVEDGADVPQPLSLPTGQRLVEPSYLLPVAGTPYVATVGSSHCPRGGAMAQWLTQVGDYTSENLEIHFVPVLRKDAAQRLRRAQAGLSLTVKLPAPAIDNSWRDPIGSALGVVKGLTGGEGTVCIDISLGRHKKSRLQGEVDFLSVIQEAESLEQDAIDLKARVRVPEGDRLKSETIDFLKDVLTQRVKIDCSPDESPSATSMMLALREAIASNQSHLSGRSDVAGQQHDFALAQ